MPIKPKLKQSLLYDLNNMQLFKEELKEGTYNNVDFIPAFGYREKNEGHLFVFGPTGAGKSYLVSQLLKIDPKKKRKAILFTDTYQTIDENYVDLLKKEKMKIMVKGDQYNELEELAKDEKSTEDSKDKGKLQQIIKNEEDEEKMLNKLLKPGYIIYPGQIWQPYPNFRPAPDQIHMSYLVTNTLIIKKYPFGYWFKYLFFDPSLYKAEIEGENKQIPKKEKEKKVNINLNYYIDASKLKSGYLKKHICIFDDCTDPEFLRIRDKLLTTGRKFGTIVISIVHDVRSGMDTKVSKNDSEWLIGYPSDNRSKLISFMVDVMRFPYHKADEILKKAALDGSNIFFHQFSPMFIASNKTIWLDS